MVQNNAKNKKTPAATGNNMKHITIPQDQPQQPPPDEKIIEDTLIAYHDQLKAMKQGQDVSSVAKYCVSNVLTTSTPLYIRALGARVLVDVLFLSAPNAPFEDKALIMVLKVLIEAIDGIREEPTSTMYACGTYVLQRMAQCKLSCLLVDLPSFPKIGFTTEDVQLNMFEVLLGAIDPAHSAMIEDGIVQVLLSFLEECESIPVTIMDTLLKRLLVEQRRLSHRAFDVASGVVSKCSERLKGDFASFVNNLLTGVVDDDLTVKDSARDLVVSLFSINPDIVSPILPRVEEFLTVDDVKSKIDNLKCLASVFCISNEQFVADNERLFSSLLRCAGDSSPEVRKELVTFVGNALVKPTSPASLAQKVLEKLPSRDCSIVELLMQDGVTEVRKEAVDVVVHLIGNNSKQLNLKSLVKALGGRTTDTDIGISLRASEGLVNGYSKNLHSDYMNANDFRETFDSVPGWVLNNYYSDRASEDDKIAICGSICGWFDETLLASPKESRAKLFRQIFSNNNNKGARLDGNGMNAFLKLFVYDRSKLQIRMRACLDGKNSSALQSFGDFKKLVEECVPEAVLCDSPSLEMMWGLKDGKVFTLLQSLIGSNAPVKRAELHDLKKDLLERIGAGLKSKGKTDASQVKNTIKYLIKRVALTTLDVDDTLEFLNLLPATAATAAVVGQTNGEEDEALENREEEFLSLYLEKFPALFYSEKILEFAKETLETVRRKKVSSSPKFRMALRIAINSPSSPILSAVKTKLVDVLKNYELESVSTLKLCTRALMLFRETSYLSDLIEKCKDLKSIAIVRAAMSSDMEGLVIAEDVFQTAIGFAHDTIKTRYKNAGATDAESSQLESNEIELKIKCIKLLGCELIRRGNNVNATAAASTNFKLASKTLALVLRKFVSDGGNPWQMEVLRRSKGKDENVLMNHQQSGGDCQWPPFEEDRFARLRLAACVELIKIESRMSPAGKAAIMREGKDDAEQNLRVTQRLMERARLAFDPNLKMRETLVAKLKKHLLAKCISMHTTCALLSICAATTPGVMMDLKESVRYILGMTLKFRVTDENRASYNAPECILSNLVYILGHHPILPKDGEGCSKYFASASVAQQRVFTKPLVVFLDVLGDAHKHLHTKSFDHSVSFMLTSIQQMRNRGDILRGGLESSVHVIGDLATRVIHQHLKYSPEALQEFKSSRIPLPGGLVERKNPTAGGGGVSMMTPDRRSSSASNNALPSPISYLPENFVLHGVNTSAVSNNASLSLNSSGTSAASSGKKKARKSPVVTLSTKKKTKLVAKKEAVDPSNVRSQPRRASKNKPVKYNDDYSSDDDSMEDDSSQASMEQEEA